MLTTPGPARPTGPVAGMGRLWSDAWARAAGAHHHLERAGRCIALTFDDGPDPEFTPLILDALSRAGIRVTFFWLGSRIRAHPGLVVRAHRDGHCIGSHSDGHDAPERRSVRALVADYRRGQDALEEVLGFPAPLFRAPGGVMTPRVALAIRLAGLRPWLWTLDPEDWRATSTPESILATMARVQGGDVILLHDGTAEPGPLVAPDRLATVDALAPLAELIRSLGLSFATLEGQRCS